MTAEEIDKAYGPENNAPLYEGGQSDWWSVGVRPGRMAVGARVELTPVDAAAEQVVIDTPYEYLEQMGNSRLPA